MTEFEGQVLSDLGIGQPGRLHQLEERVSQNEEGIHRMKGMAAAFGVLLTMLHVAISYFGGKHN
jgi:hypothetical protein